MKKALLACLALAAWTVGASAAQAFCYVPCMPICCIRYELRPVICYRQEWRAEQVPCVVERVNYRAEVSRVNVRVMAPRMFDEQVRTSCYVPTPRVVDRVVSQCVTVPVVAFDPCTCCPYVAYTTQWVNCTVRCVEYDYRQVERVENVRVCRYVPEDRVVEQVRWVPEVSQVQTWTVRYNCVTVPYQTMVWVPCWQ
jgi:hypothetical protein